MHKTGYHSLFDAIMILLLFIKNLSITAVICMKFLMLLFLHSKHVHSSAYAEILATFIFLYPVAEMLIISNCFENHSSQC